MIIMIIIFIDHVSIIIIVLFFFYSQLSYIEKPTEGKSKSNILNGSKCQSKGNYEHKN